MFFHSSMILFIVGLNFIFINFILKFFLSFYFTQREKERERESLPLLI